MTDKLEFFNKKQMKTNLPDIKPGDSVAVYHRVKEGKEEKTHIFSGVVIARKHGKEMGSTITVRKVISGVGVEKIFPLHSPAIEKIEIEKRSKVRRAKLYFLRTAKGDRAKMKRKEFAQAIAPAESVQTTTEAIEQPAENTETTENK